MSKSKIYEFKIKVRFDKPCNKSHALREVREGLYGSSFLFPVHEDEPGEIKIVKINKISESDLLKAAKDMEAIGIAVYKYITEVRAAILDNKQAKFLDIDDIDDFRLCGNALVAAINKAEGK